MLTIELLEGEFTVCKPLHMADIDWDTPFQFAAKTDGELSLVCPATHTPPTSHREERWRGLRIAGQLDFSLVGILAPIASLLAAQKISIFAVSTFDTDYIFVKTAQLTAATSVLHTAGYTVL